jgi:hypothetical protein
MRPISRTPRQVVGLVLALALPFAAGPAAAQDESSPDRPAIMIDLNGLEQNEAACRITFVVQNRHAGNIGKAIYEFALFNRSGLVERLLTLDFKELPARRTRVRQFDLAELHCADLARILVNDARECSGDGTDPAACMRDLETSTATDLQFGS